MWMQWLVHGKPDAPKAEKEDIDKAGNSHTHSPTYSPTHSPTHSLTHSPTHSLTYLLIGELIDELEAVGDWGEAIKILSSYDSKRASNLPANDWYRLRRYSFAHSPTHSPTHSITYSLIRYLEVSLSLLRLNKGDAESDDENASPPALTGCSSLTYSLTYLLTYSLIHSLRDSRVITTRNRYPLFFLKRT